jgi:hypothetical protein
MMKMKTRPAILPECKGMRRRRRLHGGGRTTAGMAIADSAVTYASASDPKRTFDAGSNCGREDRPKPRIGTKKFDGSFRVEFRRAHLGFPTKFSRNGDHTR